MSIVAETEKKKRPKKRLLMACMGSWRQWQNGFGVNRNYHVLQELRRTQEFEEIILVDVVPHTYKRGLRVQAAMTLQRYQGIELAGGALSRMTSVEEGLTVIEVPIAGLLGRAWGLRTIEKLVRARWGTTGPDIVWNYTPFLADLATSFSEAISVFDAVDDWREHQAYTKFQQELNAHYAHIAKNYDMIFTVSESVRDHLFSKHANVHWIPNGIDLEHFRTYTQDEWTDAFPIERDWAQRVAKLPTPILGYVGVIEDRVDVDLLTKIAEQHPHGSLVLVGPSWRTDTAWKELCRRPNVHATGALSYEAAPWVSSQFTVGLIPHQVNGFTKSMNPMKLLEYRAMGLPVVSTPVAGVEPREGCVFVAEDTSESFLSVLEQALKKSHSADACRDELQNHTWRTHVDHMQKLLTKI